MPRLVRHGFPPLLPVSVRDVAATLHTARVFRRDESRPAVLTVLAELREMQAETGVSERGTDNDARADHLRWREIPPRLESICCTDISLRLAPRALSTTQLGEALRNSELDVAIGYAYPMPVQQMDGVARRPLFNDELNCAMVSTHHPLAMRDELSLADLVDVPFLFPRRAVLPRLYDAVMQQFTAAGTRPRVDAEYDGVETIWTLTAQNIGWSLGTALQLETPPSGTRCVRLRDFALPWGAEVVYRDDEDRPSVLRLVTTIIGAAQAL